MTATFLSVLIVNLLYGLAYSNRTALTKIDTISVSRIGEVFTCTPPPCDDVLFVGFLARFQCLEDFAQILERLRIFGAHRLLILTAGIGPLQRAGHGSRYWDRIASMVLFADEIKLRLRLCVTGVAVHTKAVVDLGEAASEDF